MKVVIDPGIEMDSELLDHVHRANAYLEPQLGRFKDDIEVKWTRAPGPHGYLGLTLRFTDDLPVEASDSFSSEVLRPDRYSAPWLRGVVDDLFGRRSEVHQVRRRELLKRLDQEEANGEMEHAQANADGTRA